MGKRKQKRLEKARNNPSGLQFNDFETLLESCGWTFDHQTGSHRIWYSPEGVRLSIQKAKGGKAKGYQVQQFLEHYDEETNEDE